MVYGHSPVKSRTNDRPAFSITRREAVLTAIVFAVTGSTPSSVNPCRSGPAFPRWRSRHHAARFNRYPSSTTAGLSISSSRKSNQPRKVLVVPRTRPSKPASSSSQRRPGCAAGPAHGSSPGLVGRPPLMNRMTLEDGHRHQEAHHDRCRLHRRRGRRPQAGRQRRTHPRPEEPARRSNTAARWAGSTYAEGSAISAVPILRKPSRA